MDREDPIKVVREARHRISNAHDNDLQKLLAHYQALQERHRDRLLNSTEVTGVSAQQDASADG